MQSIQTVSENTIYVGASDRRLAKFENLFPIPRGVSYNAYVILDEKTALLDTADASVGAQFLENVAAALDGRKLDYLIVDHMEPDHAAMIEAVLVRWPDLRLVVNAKTLPMLKMYFPTDSAAFDDALVVKEGDTLDLGKHVGFADLPLPHFDLEHVGSVRPHIAAWRQNLDAGTGAEAERLGGVGHTLTLSEQGDGACTVAAHLRQRSIRIAIVHEPFRAPGQYVRKLIIA